jgi:DNA-binding NarL/FixJ family response regulator
MVSTSRHQRTRLFGEPLTNDERRLLQLRSEGYEIDELMAQFHRSRGTITQWSTNIYQKFGLYNEPIKHMFTFAVCIALSCKAIRGPAKTKYPPKLAPHLLAVTELVPYGLTNAQIAAKLRIKRKERVDEWLMQANECCKTLTRTHLAAFAIVHNLIEFP